MIDGSDALVSDVILLDLILVLEIACFFLGLVDEVVVNPVACGADIPKLFTEASGLLEYRGVDGALILEIGCLDVINSSSSSGKP